MTKADRAREKRQGTAKVVLTIAGSDSSAGAGLAADLKTGAAFGVYVATAVTAITAQNSQRLHALYPVDGEQLLAQLHAISSDLPIDAIKIGMLGNEELLRITVQFILNYRSHREIPVVVDPVMGATSGGALWQGRDPYALYKELLFPVATLITPNAHEAARLLGEPNAASYAELEAQATRLQNFSNTSVLLKGGHLDTSLATDYLAERGSLQPYSSPRLPTTHSHGTGCTLATAVAAGLAQGLSLKQSVAAAKTYIQAALGQSERLALTATNGPIHHFYSYW